MAKENQPLDNLKEEALSILNNVKFNNDIFNKPLEEVKEYLNNDKVVNKERLNSNLSKTTVNTENNKSINFLLYGIAGSCIVLGMFLGFPQIIKTFKNAEDPITHYSKILGYVNASPEQIANENFCTRQHLKEQVKNTVIQKKDIYSARVGCDSESLKLKAEQDKALNK